MNARAASEPAGPAIEVLDGDGDFEYRAQAFEQATETTGAGKTRVLDPYLHWAELTAYRYLGLDPSRPIRLALAMREGHSLEPLGALDGVNIIAAGDASSARCCSAQLERAATQSRAALLRCADFVLAEPGMWPIDRVARLAASRGIVAEAAPPAEPCDSGVVIGVIDGRCAFANARFCDALSGTSSLIDFFWDQGSSPTAKWQVPAGFGYGRELVRKALDEELKKYCSAPSAARPGIRADEERALYRALGQALPADADWSHGTHVLDTVLGDAMAEWPVESADRRPGVIYVQLSDGALRDTSARWAASYVLDALHYILSRAGNKAKVVVNLSLGSFAGPHDGSSLLELAIDDLVKGLGGRLNVVVAAGNTSDIRDDGSGRPTACHARATLGSAVEPECNERGIELVWDIDCTDSTESFMEIWLPQLAPDGRHAHVEVSLRHAETAHDERHAQGAHAQPGQIATVSHGDTVLAAVLNASGEFQVPNGSGGMVLVALGHTRDAAGPCARAGRWIVRITSLSHWPITLDAFVERRDVPGDLAGYRPQYGFDIGSPGTDAGGLLGSFANGAKTIVVGAAQHDSNRDVYTTSAYSARARGSRGDGGHARAGGRAGPDIFAVGQREAAGFFSGSRKSLAGTSMAAAQVSAALAAGLALAPKGETNALDSLRRIATGRTRAGKGSAKSAPHLADADGGGDVFVLPALPNKPG